MARTTAYEDGSGPELLTEIEELREEVEGLRGELRALAAGVERLRDGLLAGLPDRIARSDIS